MTRAEALYVCPSCHKANTLQQLRGVYLSSVDASGPIQAVCWHCGGSFALALDALPVAPVDAPVRNQCDGCAAGKPLDENGNHRMGSGNYPDLMACQRERYAPPDPSWVTCGSCGSRDLLPGPHGRIVCARCKAPISSAPPTCTDCGRPADPPRHDRGQPYCQGCYEKVVAHAVPIINTFEFRGFAAEPSEPPAPASIEEARRALDRLDARDLATVRDALEASTGHRALADRFAAENTRLLGALDAATRRAEEAESEALRPCQACLDSETAMRAERDAALARAEEAESAWDDWKHRAGNATDETREMRAERDALAAELSTTRARHADEINALRTCHSVDPATDCGQCLECLQERAARP